MSPKGQKNVVALSTIDLGAKLDLLAKTHFIGRNILVKNYQVWLYAQSTPKHCGKESRKVKVV